MGVDDVRSIATPRLSAKTDRQYNLSPFPKKLSYAASRRELGVAGRFADPSVRKTVEADLALMDASHEQARALKLYLTITRRAMG
jgi:hypothetical protein